METKPKKSIAAIQFTPPIPTWRPKLTNTFIAKFIDDIDNSMEWPMTVVLWRKPEIDDDIRQTLWAEIDLAEFSKSRRLRQGESFLLLDGTNLIGHGKVVEVGAIFVKEVDQKTFDDANVDQETIK